MNSILTVVLAHNSDKLHRLHGELRNGGSWSVGTRSRGNCWSLEGFDREMGDGRQVQASISGSRLISVGGRGEDSWDIPIRRLPYTMYIVIQPGAEPQEELIWLLIYKRQFGKMMCRLHWFGMYHSIRTHVLCVVCRLQLTSAFIIYLFLPSICLPFAFHSPSIHLPLAFHSLLNKPYPPSFSTLSCLKGFE